MSSVQIYGHISPSTQCVMAVCNLPGVQYDFAEVDLMNGEHKTPEFIHKRNPFGAIPVVVDNDGTRLFESRAISRYLVAKYAKGSELLPDPKDEHAYGRFEQAASIEYSSFDPYAGELVFQHFSPSEILIVKAQWLLKYTYYRMIGIEPDEKQVKK
ncbi:glutathione, partial [Rhizoctonia solani]